MKLGKLEQITDLRSIWKHEANDFTPWLAKEENLAALSDAIGIELVLEEQESNVGDFSVDLFATEEGTGRKVVIENQLEETNHDHLGKIITYASSPKLFSLWHSLSLHQQPLHRFVLCVHWYDQAFCLRYRCLYRPPAGA